MLPDDVVLVPGHADDCNMEELRRFHEMLVKTKEIVREGLAKGKTPEQLRKEDVLASFASYESYMTRSRWLDTLVAGLTVKRPERGGRAMPYGLLYKAYKEKGAEGTRPTPTSSPKTRCCGPGGASSCSASTPTASVCSSSI
jgi:hypothetical protein